jgi:hypothetical protein
VSFTHRSTVRGARPEEIAVRFMRSPPPIDLVGLARELGIRVRYEDLGSDAGKIARIEGDDGPRYEITINSQDGEARQRFTLAHEIAHYVKHRHLLDRGAVSDNALYRSHLPEPIEWEANRYAAQLLMPLSAMQQAWREGSRTASDFARRLNVSEQAAQIRFDQLKGTLALTR